MHKYILRIDYYDKKGPRGWLRYINKNNTSANSLFISSPLKKIIKEEYEKLYKYSKECFCSKHKIDDFNAFYKHQ